MTARIPALALGALLLGSTLGMALPAVAASEPTLHEVYEAVQAGKLSEADRMMDEVLRNHPGSAKAHYVEAELLAKENRNDAAKAELAQAERLDPSMAFAKASSLAELRQRLTQPGTGVMPAPARSTGSMSASPGYAPREQPRGSGMGGVWTFLLVGLVLFIIVRVVRGMRPPGTPTIINQGGPVGPYNGQPGFGSQPGYGPQPGYGGGPMGGGGFGGGGIMGSLATGAAVGAGVVAGEALMHRVIDGPEHGHGGGQDFIPAAEAAPFQPQPTPYDAGGQDFGVNDSGSWDSGSGGSGGDSDSW